jgi:hypothetical protein
MDLWNGGNMSDKRPWTPGPWLLDGRSVYALQNNPRPRKNMPDMINRWFAGFQIHADVPVEEVESCAMLTSKAPEMAELLIRLVKSSTCFDIDTFHDLLLDAQKLLKSVGWEEDND